VELLAERRVWNYLRVGGNYRVLRHGLSKVAEGGNLASGSVPGTENTTLSAPGLQATWDNRDSIWSATRGSYALLGVRLYRDALGSDYDFTELLADLRAYLSIVPGHVIALQGLVTSLAGDVPFFVMPKLGGEGGLRGYSANRYIDSTRALARAEYRWNDFWGPLSAAVFAGLGDVAPRSAELRLDAARPSYGFGLRYLIEPAQRLKIRLDFGFGDGRKGTPQTVEMGFGLRGGHRGR